MGNSDFPTMKRKYNPILTVKLHAIISLLPCPSLPFPLPSIYHYPFYSSFTSSFLIIVHLSLSSSFFLSLIFHLALCLVRENGINNSEKKLDVFCYIIVILPSFISFSLSFINLLIELCFIRLCPFFSLLFFIISCNFLM